MAAPAPISSFNKESPITTGTPNVSAPPEHLLRRSTIIAKAVVQRACRRQTSDASTITYLPESLGTDRIFTVHAVGHRPHLTADETTTNDALSGQSKSSSKSATTS
ncbi:hypothetical protein ACLOJK_026199 [Asimina triloba]